MLVKKISNFVTNKIFSEPLITTYVEMHRYAFLKYLAASETVSLLIVHIYLPSKSLSLIKEEQDIALQNKRNLLLVA